MILFNVKQRFAVDGWCSLPAVLECFLPIGKIGENLNLSICLCSLSVFVFPHWVTMRRVVVFNCAGLLPVCTPCVSLQGIHIMWQSVLLPFGDTYWID